MKKLLYLSPQNLYPPTDGGKISIYYPLLYFSRVFDCYFVFPTIPGYEKKSEIFITHCNENGIKAYTFIQNTKNDIFYLGTNLFKDVPLKLDKYFNLQAKINRKISSKTSN